MGKEHELFNNEEKKQFEIHMDNLIPRIEYTLNEDMVYYLTHTEIPVELGGQGIGKELAEKTLLYIEQKGYKMVPVCPFILAYIRRHPEWERIVAS